MKVAAGLLIISLLMWACSGNKQAMANGADDGGGMQKSVPASAGGNAVPPCIQKMIDSTKKLEPALQLTEVRRYIYNGSKVYLVGMPCCDQFNSVYDSACHLLFSPSGGFTGKGDRSHPDFFAEAKEDSLIWKKEK